MGRDNGESRGRDTGKSSETEEPWKLPDGYSQQPEQKPPPKRERTQKDNETS